MKKRIENIIIGTGWSFLLALPLIVKAGPAAQLMSVQSAGGGSVDVNRVAGADGSSNSSSTSTHTFTIPGTAELMVYFMNGYDSGETDKCLDSNFSFEDNADAALTWHQVEVTSGTIYNGAVWIADVRAEQGNSVHVDADFTTQGSGSWGGGHWQVATFYEGADMSALPSSAIEDSGIQAFVLDTTIPTTGALSTVNGGMVAGAYGWFSNNNNGAFNVGVTEYYDSTISGNQTQIIGDVDATGAPVTITGGDGTIDHHVVIGISLK